MDNMTLAQLYEKHVKNTPAETVVADVTILFCHLTFAVRRNCNFQSSKVHINTRTLKRLYDKRPAEEFLFILCYLIKIVRNPDHVYFNQDAKKGDILFTKTIKGNDYACSIQKNIEHTLELNVEKVNSVVTCFRLRKEGYLKNYKLLWSWKGDIPSS